MLLLATFFNLEKKTLYFDIIVKEMRTISLLVLLNSEKSPLPRLESKNDVMFEDC